MPAPVIVPLVKGVAQAAGKWVVQVDTASSTATPAWVTVQGSKQNTPAKSDDMVDITDLDTGGWKSSQPFMSGWTLAADLGRKKYASAFDPGQEFIRLSNWAKSIIHVRYFDRNGGDEAYEGWAYGTWENQGGGNEKDEVIKTTLTGSGELVKIANPMAVSVVAAVAGAAPTAQTAGKPVTITGAGFTGATSVLFGAVPVVSGGFNIVNDGTIVAVVPAGSAGPANITVVNPIGTSNAFGYSRGA